MHREVARATRALEGVRGLRNLHPGYASVLVDFDPRLLTHAQAAERIRERLEGHEGDATPERRHLELPVVYGGEAGPDLEEVARHTGMTAEGVVKVHCSAE